MRTLLVLFFLILFWISNLSAHVNPYYGNVDYKTVQVRSGDTVWNIAAKYTTDHEDIRELVFAIIKLNKLNNNAQVYPGQTLKIPIKSNNSVAFK